MATLPDFRYGQWLGQSLEGEFAHRFGNYQVIHIADKTL